MPAGFAMFPQAIWMNPIQMNPRRLLYLFRDWILKFAVITSVDRDDLPDGGAEHWIKTISGD